MREIQELLGQLRKLKSTTSACVNVGPVSCEGTWMEPYQFKLFPPFFTALECPGAL